MSQYQSSKCYLTVSNAELYKLLTNDVLFLSLIFRLSKLKELYLESPILKQILGRKDFIEILKTSFEREDKRVMMSLE